MSKDQLTWSRNLNQEETLKFETKMQMLNAAYRHFDAQQARARANMQIYLETSTGIGEHSDLVEEIVQFVDTITHAEDCKKTLSAIIDEATKNA